MSEDTTMKSEQFPIKQERISFRIDSLSLSAFEWLLTLNPDYNKSEVLREAVHLWMIREISNKDNPEGKIVLMNQNALRILFECADSNAIQKLVDLAVKNQEIGFKNAINRFPNGNIREFFSQFNTLNGKLNILKNYVYGKDGFAFVESFEYQIENNSLKINISSQLGQNFGTYISNLLEKHVEEFGYTLDEVMINFNRSNQLCKHSLIFYKK